MKKALGILVAISMLLSFVPQPAIAATLNPSTVYSFNISGTADYNEVQDILARLNALRASVGAGALTLDSGLTDTAMQRAAECTIFYSHTRPNGSTPWTAFPSGHGTKGENIALGYSSGAGVMSGWTNSSGHYANMVNKNYKSVGIGCFYQEGGRKTWVQVFSGNTSSSPRKTTGRVGLNANIKASGANLDFKVLPVSASKLYVGGTQQFGLYNTVNKGGVASSNVKINHTTCSSSNTSVASVDANGNVRGVGSGTAIIRMGINGNLSWEATVTVTQTHTVTFMDGDTVTKTEIVEHGKAATAPIVFVKVGYTFDGWDKAFDAVYQDMTVNAKWTQVVYPVTATAGKGGRVEGSGEYAYGTEAVLTAIPDPGYSFSGYYIAYTNYCSDPIFRIKVTSRWTLDARFTPNRYTITPTAGANGRVSGGGTFDYDTNVTLKAIPATGYRLEGWYENGELINSYATDISVEVTGNRTIEARFAPCVYLIVFDKNGGSGDSVMQAHTYDASKKLTANTYTRKGYTFNGWNTEKDGSGTKYTDKKSVKNLSTGDDITLYAQWKKVSAPTKAVTSLKLTAPKSKQLKVTYKAVSGAAGYRIQYSTSKKFTKATTKTVHTTKLTYTLKSLSAKKTYYVKVTAYKLDSQKNKIYSKKTATKNLKTK